MADFPGAPRAESELRRLQRRVLELEAELAVREERFEQQIRATQQRFSLFMANLPGFAWIKDIEGRYVYANRMVSEQMQPFRGDWLGKTDLELWRPDIANEYRSNDQSVITTCRTLQTVEHYESGNEKRYVLVTKFPV